MQCIVTCTAVRMRIYLKSDLRCKFLIFYTYHPNLLYLRKDMRIRVYFSKPKWIREQKVLETLT